MKLVPYRHGETNELLGWAHWCAGCQHAHVFRIDRPGRKGPVWSFNGNMEKPTFSPSMREFIPEGRDKDNNITRQEKTTCHYILTDGVINYLADSSEHTLRGSHPLPDFPADYSI